MERLENDFSEIAALFGDKARAKMLWNLLDGRAYTTTELANCGEISLQSASNHLSKLLQKNILSVEKQGRHRYYKISSPEVAQVIESMAGLLTLQNPQKIKVSTPPQLRYVRTCYKHMAGEVGVKIANALVSNNILNATEKEYIVTEFGEKWFLDLGIDIESLQKTKRSFARKCLDWSERRHHLAGTLGDELLKIMINKDWVRKHKNTRELMVTATGKLKMQQLLNINI